MSQNTALNPLIKNTTKALATDSAASAFQYTTSGVYTGAYLTGCGGPTLMNAQNAIITFCGTGADNATFDVRLWARIGIEGSDGQGDPAYFLQYIGVASCILSSMTGVAGSTYLPTTVRIVDTITWTPATTATTPAGNYTDLCTALGTTTGTVSNGSNTPASLILPLAAECNGIMLDFDMTGATGGNAFIQANVV